MATTERAEIDDVMAKIKEYEDILAKAIRDGNEDDKKMFANLIIAKETRLHDLNLQQQQGKVNIPHHACPFNICCFEIIL
jgi:hypothetical protein